MILTLLLIGGTGYLLHVHRLEAEEASETLLPPLEEQPTEIELDVQEEQRRARQVTIFVQDPSTGSLVRQTREITVHQTVLPEIRETIQYLIHPRPDTRNPAIPEGTELITVFMSNAGVVYLNLNRNVQDQHIGGLRAEMMTVAAFVNTLLFNFQDISHVQILVEGAEIETLAGHIDCRKPFAKMFP